MSTSSRGTPFWREPGGLISPGDVYPQVPASYLPYPLTLIKRYSQNLKPKFDTKLYTIATFGTDPVLKHTLDQPGGDDTVSRSRLAAGMLLSWGSEIEADLRSYQARGKAKGMTWLTAPIFDLSTIQDQKKYRNEETGEELSDRDIVRLNQNSHTFYLPPFASDPQAHLGRYLELRRMCPVGIEFFLEAKGARMATLTPEAKNDMYHQLMGFLTRKKLFFHPIACPECGAQVPLDLEMEGQEIDEPQADE